eukprot:scaffold176605_cov27-Prasinocladus_malaysianus.AAC.1
MAHYAKHSGNCGRPKFAPSRSFSVALLFVIFTTYAVAEKAPATELITSNGPPGPGLQVGIKFPQLGLIAQNNHCSH